MPWGWRFLGLPRAHCHALGLAILGAAQGALLIYNVANQRPRISACGPQVPTTRAVQRDWLILRSLVGKPVFEASICWGELLRQTFGRNGSSQGARVHLGSRQTSTWEAGRHVSGPLEAHARSAARVRRSRCPHASASQRLWASQQRLHVGDGRRWQASPHVAHGDASSIEQRRMHVNAYARVGAGAATHTSATARQPAHPPSIARVSTLPHFHTPHLHTWLLYSPRRFCSSSSTSRWRDTSRSNIAMRASTSLLLMPSSSRKRAWAHGRVWGTCVGCECGPPPFSWCPCPSESGSGAHIRVWDGRCERG
eukprot:359621-Chlamydomonas_euryale.AAC.2